MSPKQTRKEFKGQPCQPQFHSYVVEGRTMNYVSNGSDSLPLVVFVHGSPGSWSAFVDFFKDSILLQKIQMISVDRPGFGYSEYGKGEPSLDRQAALLKPVLEQNKKNRKLILIGHSLGGPVIVKMAMTYPELIDHMIIVAGSVDPELEPQEWYRKPMASAFIRWMLPGSIRASNEEILGLKPELEKMIPNWSSIKIPVTVIQGLQDDLVPPGNADFAKKMLVNAPVKLVLDTEMNHFIPWKKPALIRDAIMEALNDQK
ncbi:MAG TPA: alpha/beta hydrolase [Cytophagaceae bacterium]|nr:alpha/beta hydrolase [Cytophagaceae bacterium]